MKGRLARSMEASPEGIPGSVITDNVIVLAWRIVIGLSLIPAFATLYQRLTMPESSRFLMSRKLKQDAIDNSSVDDSLVSGKPENGQRGIHEHEKDEKDGKGIDVFVQEKSNPGHDSNLNHVNEEDIKANKAQFKG